MSGHSTSSATSSKRKRGADEHEQQAASSSNPAAAAAASTSASATSSTSPPPPSSPSFAAAAAEPDTSLLPHTYQTLISAFPSVLALASLLWHRGSPATYEAIRHAVGPAFTFAHLRQMVTLAPHLLCFQPLLREREGDDPFAAPLPSLMTLPIPQRYELLQTESIQKAQKAATKSHKNTFAASLSFRNDISRPKPPKPTKQAISAMFVRFKQAVVEYFARPEATMNIPECQLPPIEEVECASMESTNSVPMYARLDDRLTVSLEENTDAATAPRIVSLKHPPVNFPVADDDDDDVQIIDQPNHAVAAANSSVNPYPVLSVTSASAPSVHDSVVTAMLESSASLFPNLLTHLQQQKFYTGQITYVHHTPARKAMTCEILPSTSAASSAASSVDSKDIKDKPVFLSPSLCAALHSLSPPIKQLFSHQAQAVTALLRDKKPVVVVSTPTSSGKSLCYSIPISEALLADSQARVFALFPTKALAQDQLRSMRGLLQQLTAGGEGNGGSSSSNNLSVETYDGDTPCAVRPTVRANARVMLTNPDMLHHSILSQHHEFAHVFQKLKYVVLDETHVYRGGFGAHLCLVLRRLRRICSFYGSNPQFIFCSATISNTVPFVSTLIGFPERDIVLVDEDGSARGERHFLLWNPPFVPPKASPAEIAQAAALAKLAARAEAESGNENGLGVLTVPPRFEFSAFLDLQAQTKRKSAFMESAILLANLVQRNYHSICFAHCRKVVELVADWTKMILNMTKSTVPLVPLVRPYRGGYSPEERRSIEREMFSGKLRGIVSTNALELGIDIGTLDASVHIGLPATAASLAQQSGRAGRGTRPSLSILVAHDSPLDQFYVTHPSQLFLRRPERCVVDFEAPHLLLLHLICAAFEVPLTPDSDRILFGPRFDEVFETLLNEKQWIARRPVDPAIPSRYDFKPAYDLLPVVWEPTLRAMVAQQKYINPDRGPATFFAIRNMHQRVYTIIDDQGHVLDETEERRAMFDLFPGALYPNQGREYLVEEMNRAELKIRVKQIRGCKFYTHCIDHKHATILSRNLTFSKASMKGSNGSMNEEEEEKVPVSTSQALTAIHATLTNKTAANSTAATSAAAASSYMSMSHWYIKPEQPLTWLDLCAYGRVKVDTSVYGYNRFSKLTNKVLDRVDLNLPLHEFETWGAWLDVPLSIQFAFEKWAQENPTTLPLHTNRPHANGKTEHKKTTATASTAAAPPPPAAAASSSAASPSPKKGRTRKRMKREDGTHVTVDSDDRSFGEVHPFIADTLKPPSPAAAAAAASSSSSSIPSFSLQPTTETENNLIQAQVTHHFHAGLHGLNHCMISLLPMYLLCDGAADFQCECPSIFERSYETRAPRPHRLILWERIPSAGPAFVRETARTIHQLVAHAVQVIEACSCHDSAGLSMLYSELAVHGTECGDG